MIEVKDGQVVITVDAPDPEDYITNLRGELIECVSGNELYSGAGKFSNLLNFLQEILPTYDQEKKIHK